MGLNHQSASLVRARRAFHAPNARDAGGVCLFALHTERWAAAGPGERCIPIGELYDIAALSKLVPIRLVDDVDSAGDWGRTRWPTQGWSSQRVEREHSCGASHATLCGARSTRFAAAHAA